MRSTYIVAAVEGEAVMEQREAMGANGETLKGCTRVLRSVSRPRAGVPGASLILPGDPLQIAIEANCYQGLTAPPLASFFP